MDHFNLTGWVAYFSGTDAETARARNVESWDEGGVALVVDPERARWNAENADGSPLIESVLAWLVASDGSATPLTVDVAGLVETAASADLMIAPDGY